MLSRSWLSYCALVFVRLKQWLSYMLWMKISFADESESRFSSVIKAYVTHAIYFVYVVEASITLT